MTYPYVPPTCDEQQGRPPLRVAFDVGISERHTVGVFLSMWGAEVYTVDNVEVLQLSSLSLRVTRRLIVGVTEKHLVEVVLDATPTWRSLVAPDWKAEVHVDGKLLIPEIFPDLRRRLTKIQRFANWMLVVLLGLGLVFLAFCLLLAEWVVPYN